MSDIELTICGRPYQVRCRDGEEENLRAAGRTTPILVLSARTLTEDRTRAFDSGADQYMMKPFDKEILEAKFQQIGLI